MPNNKSIANRVLLAGAIVLAMILLLVGIGVWFTANDVDKQTFIPLKVVLAVVCVAVVIGDRIYVARRKP